MADGLLATNQIIAGSRTRCFSATKPIAAEVTTILGAKSGDGSSAPALQPVYPVNVRCKLAGGAAAVNVVVIVTGVLANGTADTETIAVGPGNADYDGVKAFASISDIAYTGTWDGGNIIFHNGLCQGLPDSPIAAVHKVIFNGANEVVNTVSIANGTYVPTGAIDGLKPLEISYSL